MITLLSMAFAGPWVRDEGAAYVKAEVSSFAGLPGRSAEASGATYVDARATAYAEVGLGRGFQVTGFLPYIAAANVGRNQRAIGLSPGDAQLGVTYGLDQPVSFEVRLQAPLYVDRSEKREQFGLDSMAFAEVGDGSISAEALTHVGTSFKGGWAQAAAGYRVRFGDRADAIAANGAVGLTPAFGWIGVRVDALQNLRDDGVSRQWVSVGSFAAFSLSKKLKLEVAATVLPAARMSSPGASAGVGVSWSR